MIIIAIAVKAGSSGPAFYRGLRSGLAGNPFYIFKFRTMPLGSEKPGGDTTAKNDPRLTSIGRVIRKYKVDELPQFINILRGEMAVVGPRPELPHYTNCYSDDEKIILSVKPGLTDFSSIHYASLDEVVGTDNVDIFYEKNVLKHKNALRAKYARSKSFRLDIKLIVVTFFVVLKKYLAW